MIYGKNTVYVTGISRLSKSDPIFSNYEVFFIGIVIDKDTDIIVDSTCNMVKEKTETFINSILEGYNLKNEINNIEKEINTRFHGIAQKAIIAAVKDARNKYISLS